MQDSRKTKTQLIEENAALRRRITELESQRRDELGTPQAFVGITHDIPERQQLEDTLRASEENFRSIIEQSVDAALQEDIRQRLRIEEMLRRSEQRYRTLFDSAGDAIFILALSGQIEEVNRAACERLGYAHDEVLQMHLADIIVPEQRLNVSGRLEKTRQQAMNSFETIYQRHDGTLLHVEVNSRVMEYAGKPAFLSITRDITERKQIEETLRRSEAGLAEAQRIAHFGSWTWDLVTGKLQCSDEMFRLVGLVPQSVEVTQEVFLKFLHPDDVAGILERIQYVGTNEPLAGLEHRLIRSTGEIRHVYSRVKVYRDENGSPLRLQGSTQDITDRKQAEQSVHQYADEQAALYEIALRLTAQLNAPELLQLLVEQAVTLLRAQSGGLYLYDAQQDTLVLTQAIGFFSEYIGLALRPGEGLSGQAFQTRQVLTTQDYGAWGGRADLFKNDRRLKSVIAAPLLGKHSVLGVLTMANEAGQQSFSDHSARLAELFAAQAAIALENAQLYERQQEQYHRLQDAQARLIQSEKMSALGRLIASISHEINNPLQAVQGCLTLIREGVEEELPRLSGVEVAPWLRDLDVASAEVQRIAAIVQRLRDFYRPGRPGLQATNVSVAINSVLMLAAKQLQHSRIAVEQAAVTEPPIIINTNADQLKQVVLNLVLNAIDAMPNGGSLRVTTTPETLWVADRALPAVRIDFTDTGHGIPPDHLAHIFEPFFTTKATGSGLGLSISYELVKALGGDLNVVSQVGVGTTFTVRLPLEPNYKSERAL